MQHIQGCKSVCMDRPALGKVGNVSLRYQTSWRVFLFGAIRSRNYRKMAFPCSAISIFLCDFTGKIPQTCIKCHHAPSQSNGIAPCPPWVPPWPLIYTPGSINRLCGFWGLHILFNSLNGAIANRPLSRFFEILEKMQQLRDIFTG